MLEYFRILEAAAEEVYLTKPVQRLYQHHPDPHIS